MKEIDHSLSFKFRNFCSSLQNKLSDSLNDSLNYKLRIYLYGRLWDSLSREVK